MENITILQDGQKVTFEVQQVNWSNDGRIHFVCVRKLKKDDTQFNRPGIRVGQLEFFAPEVPVDIEAAIQSKYPYKQTIFS